MPLAFVIPVVHPDGRRVSSYDYVEKSLYLTLCSLTARGHGGAPVYVVCHRKPDWHTEFSPTVKFLIIPEHPWFPDDVKDRFSAEEGDKRGVRVDMGLKYLAGMIYAMQACDPEYLMPMDGDDFVRGDLIETVKEIALDDTETDCFLISHGYHIPLRKTDSGYDLQAAFQLDRFDETCGTSRVFNSKNFRQIVARHGPELLEFEESKIVEKNDVLQHEFLDCLGQLAERDVGKEPSFVRLLGSHTTQDVLFNVSYIDVPLSAKACGHGNHVGWQNGGLHWRKLYKVASSRKFMTEFGIANTSVLSHSLSLGVKIRGLRSIYRNKRNQRNQNS